MKKSNFYILLLLVDFCFECNDKAAVATSTKTPLISDSLSRIITIDTVKSDNIQSQITLSGEVDFDENKVVKIFPNAS